MTYLNANNDQTYTKINTSHKLNHPSQVKRKLVEITDRNFSSIGRFLKKLIYSEGLFYCMFMEEGFNGNGEFAFELFMDKLFNVVSVTNKECIFLGMIETTCIITF